MERTTVGWGSGLLGVVIFSGSLPATRAAVVDFTPIFSPRHAPRSPHCSARCVSSRFAKDRPDAPIWCR